MSSDTKKKKATHRPPGTSGYPEPQPVHRDGKSMPDERSPHEPQNVPQQKPKQP